MRSSTRPWTVILGLPALLALLACPGERRERPPAEQPPQEVAQATYQLEVSNPMPHAMTVYAEDGTGEVQLGTVEPTGSALFTITAPASTTLKLRAQDAEGTHIVTGQAILTEGITSSWTIQ